MSGSNAIAAAKRRRGGTEISKPTQFQNKNQPQSNSSAPPSQIHPLQLVMINHERLNKLSNEFSQFPQALDGLGENFNALSSNCDFLHEKLESLESKLNTLNLNSSEGSESSNKSLNVELNNRVELIETRVNDLFKQFATLQSYMLELTLSVNNCKNNIVNMNGQFQEQYKTISDMISLNVTTTAIANTITDINQECDIESHATSNSNTNLEHVNDNLMSREELQNVNYII